MSHNRVGRKGTARCRCRQANYTGVTPALLRFAFCVATHAQGWLRAESLTSVLFSDFPEYRGGPGRVRKRAVPRFLPRVGRRCRPPGSARAPARPRRHFDKLK
jgi:hypothetical protein